MNISLVIIGPFHGFVKGYRIFLKQEIAVQFIARRIGKAHGIVEIDPGDAYGVLRLYRIQLRVIQIDFRLRHVELRLCPDLEKGLRLGQMLLKLRYGLNGHLAVLDGLCEDIIGLFQDHNHLACRIILVSAADIGVELCNANLGRRPLKIVDVLCEADVAPILIVLAHSGQQRACRIGGIAAVVSCQFTWSM